VTPTTIFSQRAVPYPLWLETFRERPIGRGTTRTFHVRYRKAKRGYASRVSLAPGTAAGRTRGEKVEEAEGRVEVARGFSPYTQPKPARNERAFAAEDGLASVLVCSLQNQ